MSDMLLPAAKTLRDFALELPGAYEDHPWDELVIKVNKKVFVFFGLAAELDKRLLLTVKLPETGPLALQMAGVTPSGYGLGKAGWVTAQFPPDSIPSLDMLMEWIEESYCAVAPKRLVAQLAASRPAPLPTADGEP